MLFVEDIVGFTKAELIVMSAVLDIVTAGIVALSVTCKLIEADPFAEGV